MFRNVVVAILLGLFLVGCMPISEYEQTEPENTSTVWLRSDRDIQRYYDAQADVVCWFFITSGGYDGQGGMSCLPRSQTDLSLEQLAP